MVAVLFTDKIKIVKTAAEGEKAAEDVEKGINRGDRA